jgi:putative RNA 2'-phosphotransferase
VEELIACAGRHGRRLDRAIIERVVATNDKKRFALSDDGLKIRASQGHSVEVDLTLEPRTPPEALFHGTATRFLESIRAKGLLPGNRNHVHLSPDHLTAVKVGERHGRPVVLRVRAGAMSRAEVAFFLSDNGVWLTAHVPVEFLEFP